MVREDTQTTQAVQVAAPQQITSRNIPTLERKIDDAAVSRPETIELVLSAVQLVDSAALNWMLSLQTRLETQQIKLRLVDLSPVMADVLLATRLDTRLPVPSKSDPLLPAAVGGAHGR